MAATESGLRERKKQRTREAIVRVALELFHDRGFEATTIADIAAAADIAPRTFFGYFPSKEAVVFHDFEEVLAHFGERLRERSGTETAFDAMRDWIAAFVEEADLSSDAERARRRLIRTTPALQAHDRCNLARLEEVLAEAVAADLDVPRDSLRPHLVAAAAVAALEALSRFDDETTSGSSKDALAIMDEALVFLRGGLEALRRHP